MITVHHLTFSRSMRILWLLEELNLPYHLVVHERNAAFRAPDSLKAVHPLGKAPVILDDGLVLAESAAILRHIDARYGNGQFSPTPHTNDASLHDEWLQYSESTAAMPILLSVIGDLVGGLTPGLSAFIKPELEKNIEYIASSLKSSPYLLGQDITLADIQLSYLLLIAHKRGLTGDRPEIAQYISRLEARPALVKAIAIGGPFVHAGEAKAALNS